MNSRKLASIVAVLGLTVVGCDNGEGPNGEGTTFPERDFVCPAGDSPPCATTADLRTAEARTQPEGEDAEMDTYTFVVNFADIPEPVGGNAAGFNLDGLNSGDGFDGTCEEFHPDFNAAADPGHVGVDNQLPGILALLASFIGDEDISELLLEQINSGSFLLLAEVSNVQSLRYDSNVTLQLYLGDATAELEIGADGRLAPGQTFTGEAIGPSVSGDIFDGRLAARTDQLPLNIDAGEFQVSLVIRSAQVRFNIGANGLTGGVVGGSILVQDVVDLAEELADAGSIAEGILSAEADIDPSAADEEECLSISVGLEMVATTAVRN